MRELIDAGTGAPFDAGKGHPMREWLAMSGTDPAIWQELADEALRFVGR